MNKQEAIELVKNNKYDIGKVPIEFLDDKDFILAIIDKWNYYKLESFIKHHGFFDSFEFVSQLLDIIPERSFNIAREIMNNHLASNETIALKLVTNDFMTCRYVNNSLKHKRQFALKAVKINPFTLQYLDWFNSDVEVVGAAFAIDPISFIYASNEFKSKEENAAIALDKNGLLLSTLPLGFRNSFYIVLKAVKQNGLALEYASRELQNNRDIVMEAVKQNGLALQFASRDLTMEREIVLEAVRQNPGAGRYGRVQVHDDAFLHYMSGPIKERSYAARKVIVERVKENYRLLRKYDPESPFVKAMFEKSFKDNGLDLTYN